MVASVKARRPELARLLRRLPLALLAATLIWLAAKPVYNRFIATTAQLVARTLEHPAATLIRVEGDRALIGRSDFKPGSAWLKLALLQIHFNLVVFLTLVLALPGALRGRGAPRGLVALGVLALSHVLLLLLETRVFFAFSLGAWSMANYTQFDREAFGFLRVFFQLPVAFALPVVAWIAAFHDRVLPLLGLPEEVGGATPRAAGKRAGRQG